MTPLPVCFVLPDLAGGGAQRVILELAGGLDPSRFAVTLVVIGGSQTLADQVSPAVQVVRLGADRIRHGIPQLVRCLRRLEPAVIVSVMGYLNLTLLGSAAFAQRPAAHRRSRGQCGLGDAPRTSLQFARAVALSRSLSARGRDRLAGADDRNGNRQALRRAPPPARWSFAIPSTRPNCAGAPRRRSGRRAMI